MSKNLQEEKKRFDTKRDAMIKIEKIQLSINELISDVNVQKNKLDVLFTFRN